MSAAAARMRDAAEAGADARAGMSMTWCRRANLARGEASFQKIPPRATLVKRWEARLGVSCGDRACERLHVVVVDHDLVRVPAGMVHPASAAVGSVYELRGSPCRRNHVILRR